MADAKGVPGPDTIRVQTMNPEGFLKKYIDVTRQEAVDLCAESNNGICLLTGANCDIKCSQGGPYINESNLDPTMQRRR
jgi:hypothetical protein